MAPVIPSGSRFVSGMQDLVPFYSAFILDVYGLLHDGIKVFPGILQCLENLRALGKKTVLVSNSPRRSAVFKKHLEEFGISDCVYQALFTSGEALYHDLKSRAEYSKKCYFMGQSSHRGLVSDLSLACVDDIETADFILNTGPENIASALPHYKVLLGKALEKNLDMVCSNPDKVVQVGAISVLCAGTLAQTYEDMGGSVRYYGKPHAFIYELALDFLKTDPSQILAVGDSLTTDVLGARGQGIASALVFSGIHGAELGLSWGVPPSPQDIETLTGTYGIQADYYLSGFQWSCSESL